MLSTEQFCHSPLSPCNTPFLLFTTEIFFSLILFVNQCTSVHFLKIQPLHFSLILSFCAPLILARIFYCLIYVLSCLVFWLGILSPTSFVAASPSSRTIFEPQKVIIMIDWQANVLHKDSYLNIHWVYMFKSHSKCSLSMYMQVTEYKECTGTIHSMEMSFCQLLYCRYNMRLFSD